MNAWRDSATGRRNCLKSSVLRVQIPFAPPAALTASFQWQTGKTANRPASMIGAPTRCVKSFVRVGELTGWTPASARCNITSRGTGLYGGVVQRKHSEEAREGKGAADEAATY